MDTVESDQPLPSTAHDIEDIPLIRLQGLREITTERTRCSLVFEFATDSGRGFSIPIAEFVQIIQFLQSAGTIPELPWDWVFSMGNDYGYELHSPTL